MTLKVIKVTLPSDALFRVCASECLRCVCAHLVCVWVCMCVCAPVSGHRANFSHFKRLAMNFRLPPTGMLLSAFTFVHILISCSLLFFAPPLPSSLCSRFFLPLFSALAFHFRMPLANCLAQVFCVLPLFAFSLSPPHTLTAFSFFPLSAFP